MAQLTQTPTPRPRNLDTDPATETAFFHYDTTASSDLDLLTHGLDGTVDPPVQVQRDLLGRIIFDGIYFYGYDAWGRLTQINLAEFDTNGDPQQGVLVRHFVYDGLGRTIRVQRAADSGFINDPEASYVSSEFLFYDGMRRIADVVAAPVYDKYSALVTGGESGENQNEAGQEAGLFVDGRTANTGFEHLELGGETYLQVHREYVWDPDPDYSPFGGVDTLVAYFDGADRDKAWHVIQNEQGDPVAIVGGDAEQDANIVWRAAFEPYGSVAWSSVATMDPFPRLAMGHKGLFVERLDAPPAVWFADDDERLTADADLLVLMRNRQYLPRLGRFLQPDPNATGVAVQPSLAYGGSALPTPDPYIDLNAWAADGTSALAYALSDPVNGADPTGLFFDGFVGLLMAGVDQWMNTTDVFDQAYQGVSIGLGLWDRIDRHYAMQAVDAEWASNWNWSDDWFQNEQIDDGLQGVVDNVGPVVASARMPIGQRLHGGFEHNTMMRHEIMTLLDNRSLYGYKSRAEMLRNIRFNQAVTDVNGKTLSNMRPDIAFLNKKTGKIDVIEIEWSNSTGKNRELALRRAYGGQMGDFHVKGRGKYRMSKTVRFKNVPISPRTFINPRRR